MSASNNGFEKDRNRASKAGKKSKRKPLDVTLADFFEKYIAGKQKIKKKNYSRIQLMFDAAYGAFLKGNSKPLAYLVDRGFGRPVSHDKLEVDNKTDYTMTAKEYAAARKKMLKKDDV